MAPVLEALEEAVALADHGGRIVHANAAFGRLFEAAAAARSIDSLFTGQHRPPSTAELAVAEAPTWSCEARLAGKTPTGTARIAQVRIARVAGPAGTLAGFTLVLNDLTDRRREGTRLRTLETAVEQCLEPVLITEAEPIDEPGPAILLRQPGRH